MVQPRKIHVVLVLAVFFVGCSGGSSKTPDAATGAGHDASTGGGHDGSGFDAPIAVDGALNPDAGTPPDAESFDAGASFDAFVPSDTGPDVDAGMPGDAAAGDAAAIVDAGSTDGSCVGELHSGICNAVNQCGCPSSPAFQCLVQPDIFHEDDPTHAFETCSSPIGTIELGEPCMFLNDCVLGTQCWSPTTGAPTVCMKYCYTNADCPTPLTCMVPTIFGRYRLCG